MNPPNPDALVQKTRQSFVWLKWHFIAYGTVIVLILAAVYMGFGASWQYWLAMGWGAVLLIHFFIVKSLNVSEDWAYERAADLRQHSYDHRHIDAIRGHYIKPRE